MVSPMSSPLTSLSSESPSPPTLSRSRPPPAKGTNKEYHQYGSLTTPGPSAHHQAPSSLASDPATSSPRPGPPASTSTGPSSSSDSAASSHDPSSGTRASDADRNSLPHPSAPRTPQRLRLHVSIPQPPNPFSYYFNQQLRAAGLQPVRVTAQTNVVQHAAGLQEYILEEADPVETEYEFWARRRELGRVAGRGGRGSGVVKRKKVCKPAVLVRRLDVAAEGVWPRRDLGMRGRVQDVVERVRATRRREMGDGVEIKVEEDGEVLGFAGTARGVQDGGGHGNKRDGSDEQRQEVIGRQEDGELEAGSVERLAMERYHNDEEMVDDDDDDESDGEQSPLLLGPLTPEERTWMVEKFAMLHSLRLEAGDGMSGGEEQDDGI